MASATSDWNSILHGTLLSSSPIAPEDRGVPALICIASSASTTAVTLKYSLTYVTLTNISAAAAAATRPYQRGVSNSGAPSVVCSLMIMISDITGHCCLLQSASTHHSQKLTQLSACSYLLTNTLTQF